MTEFLTPKVVAIIRSRRENTLAQERRRGRGPRWIRDGSRILYPARDLASYLRSLPNGGGVPPARKSEAG
jgi:hypothetical protein